MVKFLEIMDNYYTLILLGNIYYNVSKIIFKLVIKFSRKEGVYNSKIDEFGSNK